MVVLNILSFGYYHKYQNQWFNDAIDKENIDLAARAIKRGATNYVESEKLQQLIADGKMFSVSFLFAQTAGSESGEAFKIARDAVRSDLEAKTFLQVFDLYRLYHPTRERTVTFGESHEDCCRQTYATNLEHPAAIDIEIYHDGVQPDLLSHVEAFERWHPERRVGWHPEYWVTRDPYTCLQFLAPRPDQKCNYECAEKILSEYLCVLDEVFEPLHERFCPYGGTPLHAAVRGAITKKHYQMVELLLKHGAKPDIEYDGKTPFELAMEREDVELCKLFFRYVDVEGMEKIGALCDKKGVLRPPLYPTVE